MRRVLLSALLAFTSPIAIIPLRAQNATDYKDNPKFQSAMREAKQLEREHKYSFAIDSYKKANKIAEGKDIECLRALSNAQISNADYKGAIVTTGQLEAIATTPVDKSFAESERGRALYFEAGDKK